MRSLRRVPPDEDELGPLLADPRRALHSSAILLASAAILFLVVWSTASRHVLQHGDDAFLRLMRDLRWSPLVSFSKALAFIGGAWINWTVRILVVAVLIWRRQWLHLTAFTLAVATSEAFIGPVKALYDRPRPAGGLTSTSGAAFPSGHSVAAAVTAVGLVLVLLPPGHRRWVWERRAAYYASLVALSRCYLADHWLSDVVTGGLLGSGIAIGWPALLVDLRVRRAARRGEATHE